MMKLFLLFFALIVFSTLVIAQTKPLLKPDSAKSNIALKSATKADTPNVRFPLVIPSVKFDRIDSADLKLTVDIPIEKYGYIDTADLRMTSCSFEKDANAMVLFDRAVMACGMPDVIMERQKRIKIFNDNGKSEANIRIEYSNRFGSERILGIEAETINLNNGKIEYTKLDPKLVYGEHTDKNKDALVFSMPNVKPGSVIEYRYMWERGFSRNVPDWAFQSNLPTRYSQIDVLLNPMIVFTASYRKNQPFAQDAPSMRGLGHVWALRSVPSAKDEPYMRSAADALQRIVLVISSIRYNGLTRNISASWADVGREIADDKVVSKTFDQSLHDENDIIKQAKVLKTDDEKVAFLFNQVKTLMKWNEEKNWLSTDGIKSAWKKKSGNWGEINMILCRLLKESGIKAYPMLVSTRDNGQILPNFIDIYQINKLVIYVPAGTAKYYILDATDKYNSYKEIPFDLLNSYGLWLDKEDEKYELLLMKTDELVNQTVFINAEIKGDGTMKGTAQISGSGYNKSNSVELYKTLDEKKYKEFLTDNDNNLRITSLKLENAEVDSLPLIQTMDFTLDLPGTDEKYIYFNPNLFTLLHENPFTNPDRVSDIDFGCNKVFSINGRYKMPEGYKIEAIPKSMNLVIGDKTITFKRIIGEQDGFVLVYYVIIYKKSFYLQDSYPDIYAYFKKMTEILNEQIVLKKG